MNTKKIDLEVDYIDSRSITKKELNEVSAYICNRKQKVALPAQKQHSTSHLPIVRKKVKLM